MDRLHKEARSQLIEVGGRLSHDLGVGRILGQILVYLYLQEEARSLDQATEDLGLSKASVSIGVRQLEQLGLARKVWKSGDRKSYYKSAENITNAVRQGLLSNARQKVKIFGNELDGVSNLLQEKSSDGEISQESAFIIFRVRRAQDIQKKLDRLLGNPILTLLSRFNF